MKQENQNDNNFPKLGAPAERALAQAGYTKLTHHRGGIEQIAWDGSQRHRATS